MSSEDLARLRAHLARSDARQLSFVSPVPEEVSLVDGIRAVGMRGHALALVDLSGADLLDRDLDTATWRQRVVGDVGGDDLAAQLDRAVYLGLGAVRWPLQDDPGRLRLFAELVQRSDTHVWLQVPWDEDGWSRFDAARRFLGHHRQIHVALDVRGDPPEEDVVRRWCAEPVEALVAEVAHEALAPLFRSVAERVIVDGSGLEPALAAVHRAAWADVPERERHAAGFAADAIVPVEPLGDDLPSETYELIESDDVKYRAYREAMTQVLAERKRALVAVVGAGRGGLVHEVVGATQRTGADVRLLALEKNPGAVRTLKARNDREWNGSVEVIDADMRDWSPPEPLDVVVSELLGGFGDNELSPECLAPVERHLAEGAVMVPGAYTSYVAPVHAAPMSMAVTNREHMHTVAMDRARLLAEPGACFTFAHPGDHAFEQDVHLSFELEATGVLHGFAGFFEATLFGDVTLSIHPTTHTPRMRSWTPVFFPLRDPPTVAAKERIDVTFYRRGRRNRVWYEWVITGPALGRLHNAGGGAFSMRSEVF